MSAIVCFSFILIPTNLLWNISLLTRGSEECSEAKQWDRMKTDSLHFYQQTISTHF